MVSFFITYSHQKGIKDMPNKHRILFIGAGRMAEAIFAGLLTTSKEYIEEIIVSNRSNIEKLNNYKGDTMYPLQQIGNSILNL